MVDLTNVIVSPDASLREAMASIDRNAKGIVLVVDRARRLMGTVTDGDIRRAILGGMSLDLPVALVLEQRAASSYPGPITAPVGTPHAELIRLMNHHRIRHIPLLDPEDRVQDVALLSDLVTEYELPLTAVVMAGGFGSRLRPLTEELPKPMLPLRDRPLLQLTIERLRDAGIRRVHLTTHYKANVISEHFGDGSDFGVEIRYVEEDQPLGTAGGLSLLGEASEPLLVLNGDIVTDLDYRAMLDFHREQQAEMTVAVRAHGFRIPYGVVEIDGVSVVRIAEKPVSRHFINAGIYLLDPGVCRLVPSGQPYDMPELITRLLGEGRRVIGFPISEYWIDIGQVEDYQRALADAANREL
ncbi:MAG: nucleotidyltransferase family protein [Gemmatimonadetes bacterium]|nr:nucleotidyltransferase family protein [Gemmatimonadota bacterium]